MTEKGNQDNKRTRREFLKDAGLIAGGAALSSIALVNACGGTTTVTGPGTTVNNTTTETKTVTGPGTTVNNTTTVTTTVTPTPTIKPNITIPPQPDSKYMIVTDPITCVGCRRCELVCTEYNLGKAKPSIAGIKVSRSANFGPGGSAFEGMGTTHHGLWGDGRIIAETCKQCSHPIPCMEACPNGAIEVSGPWNARVVNVAKCVGCGLCAKACPWVMITVDNETKKARKCDLCNGNPECEKVCPTGSVKVISWVDRTGDAKAVNSVPGYVGVFDQKTCVVCH